MRKIIFLISYIFIQGFEDAIYVIIEKFSMPLFVIRIPARKIMKANKRTSFLGFVNVATLTPRYEPGMEPITRNITR